MAKQYSNSDKNKHVKEALRQKDSLEGTITAYAKAQGIPHTTAPMDKKIYGETPNPRARSTIVCGSYIISPDG